MRVEMSTDSGEGWMIEATAMVNMIHKVSNHYHAATEEKTASELHKLREFCFQTLSSVPTSCRDSNYARSVHYYLIGKCLDSGPLYNHDAEYYLSLAIELNSGLVDAWRCLGNCAMKRRDYTTAKERLDQAIKIDEQDKMALCQLSLMENLQFSDSGNKEHIDRSMEYARKAVEVDKNDGYSLFILGCAYMAWFTKGGQGDPDQIQHALNAFKEAKRDAEMRTCPTLLYQSAVGNTFLENYETALMDYKRSSWVYPKIDDHSHHCQNLIELLNQLDKLLQEEDATFKRVTHCCPSGLSKKRKEGSSGLTHCYPSGLSKKGKEGSSEGSMHPLEYKSVFGITFAPIKVTLEQLSQGHNRGKALDGKVLHLVNKKPDYPRYYVLHDTDMKRFIVTIHGIQKKDVKKGNHVTLMDPLCSFVDFKWEGKHYQFKSVRVNANNLGNIRVNGKNLADGSSGKGRADGRVHDCS